MVNIKLGDKTYEGVEKVKLNTTDGGEAVFVEDGGEVLLQDKTITENGEYTADAGYDGLGKVTVEVAGGGGGTTIKTATVSDLELFDLVKFGRHNGNDLMWFVSDTGYEGHIILTLLRSTDTLRMCFNRGDSFTDKYSPSWYRTSAARQFLNATSIDWYSPQIEGALSNAPFADPGFLSSFSNSEIEKIIPFESKCVEYTSGTAYTIKSCVDRVWIPSKKQCGGSAGTAEGSRGFEATSLSANMVLTNIIGSDVFSMSRTQAADGIIAGATMSSITSNYSVLIKYPICISIDPNAMVRTVADEFSVNWWEVDA